MRCLKASELMSLHLDSELPPQEEQALQQHLLTCPSCRAEWQTMQQACALFSEVTLIAPAPNLSQRVMAKIRRHESRLAILRNGVVVLLSVLLLAALSFSSWMAAPPMEVILHSPALVSAIVGILVGAMDVLGTLLRAAALVLQAIVTSPGRIVLLGYVALAGALAIWWIRLVSGRTIPAPTRDRP